MITFKRISGKNIVTVDGVEYTFDMMWDALEFIYIMHRRKARASL